MYDDHHRYNVLSTLKDAPRPREQKGIRERLLCSECEGKLSVWEKYAAEALLGGVPLTIRQESDLILVDDLDYHRFKLFQLSILWRAAIASHTMFARVKLGPHEERIRSMILASDPGKTTTYPCAMFGLTSESGIQSNFIDQPYRVRYEGIPTYRFIFLGFMWVFFVSSHAAPTPISKVAASEKGTMAIARGRIEDIDYLREFAVELKKQGKLRL